MDHSDVREEVVSMLRRDLFGPYAGDREVIATDNSETPINRYSTGILYPVDAAADPFADVDSGDESGVPVDTADGRMALSNSLSPSCYGISFSCLPGTKELRAEVKAGQYLPDVGTEGSITWTRVPVAKDVKIPVQSSEGSVRFPVVEGLDLVVRFRNADRRGLLPITMSMVNRNTALRPDEQGTKRSKDGISFAVEMAMKSFFQCQLIVKGSGARPFTERRSLDVAKLDREVKSTLLLHRHARDYAAGHGCSADWEQTPEECVEWVSTSFIPQYDLYPMMPPEDLGLPEFRIRGIATSTPEDLKRLFLTLCDKYGTWIGEREASLSKVPAELKDVATEHLRDCRMAQNRIRRGIDLLSDPVIYRAFILSHEAMLHVFARSRWQHKGCPPEGPAYDDNHSWRPFQIAFILQCLEGVSDPKSSDRSIADLLWFPTGGGKTEAYLGLTAFVFFLRRLRAKALGGDGGGTAVLMRYTLRLLTADQFARASLMACACELVRRGSTDLKLTAPVSVGLWVGSGATPNSLKDAKEALDHLHAGKQLPRKLTSPVKLLKCPWCGEELRAGNYSVDAAVSGVRVKCPAPTCEFGAGLPVALIDDHVYAARPSLLIGTVDKFARIPWKAEAGTIFSTDGKYAPPELIIQDELHLISGPLGTLVGLYEPVVDELCSRTGIPPKIIASTATIRNSAHQIRALFNRAVAQFPPPCLDSRDSFFAREDRTKSARRYVGVFTPGKSPMTAYIRTAADLLHGVYAVRVPEADRNVKDPYWTIITYFNSLRELGGALVRTRDDTVDYVKFCAGRDGRTDFRVLSEIEELTSRKSSSELDDIRVRLSDSYPDHDPLDDVLCSNMVSVGLDVPRLGVMLMVGQPKTTAEYIQATSRIGRQYPGLVVTLYNWTRSRDRSHYERFRSYHSRLYSEVEATSVTPFSSRARDRGLHAVLVALSRHLDKTLAPDAGAKKVGDSVIPEQIIARLQARIAQVDSMESEDAERQLREILDEWRQLGTDWPELFYDKDPDNSLLVNWEAHSVAHRGFATLNSMRNVDVTAGVYLK